MKKFLAVYIGSGKSAGSKKWWKLDKKTRAELEQAGVAAWMGWVIKNKKQIVDTGSPLGKTKRASKRGISNTGNEITAYTVVQAKSHAAAAKLFRNHPHFTIFPGDSIEIMECLPIPGM